MESSLTAGRDAAVLPLRIKTRNKGGAPRIAGQVESAELLQALPVAVYTTDAAGRITFYNEAAAALWGCRPELGKSEWCGSWRLYWPDGRPMPHGECPMAVALREGRPIRGAEAVAERPDGTRVPFIPFPMPLFDESGTMVGAINTLVDITDRKERENAAQRLVAVIESSDDAIVSKDLDGTIVTWNPGAERLFGYTAEEIVGKPIAILIPSDRHDEEPEILARIRRGERIEHYETVRRRKDGRLIEISLTVSPIKDANGTIIGASKIARDISERKRAEEALRQTQEQLHVALTASDTGTFRWNPYTGEFLAFDENLKRLFGFAPDELVTITEDFIVRIHPDDKPRLVAAINRCREGADLEMEFRVVHPDGSIHWLYNRAKMERDAEGNPTYLVGACTDVTQRTQSEYAARETAQRFLFMAETMPQKIFTATANGDVNYFNRQWLEFSGLTLAQIRGWGWTQLVHPDDIEENIRVWRHSIETGEPFEFVHRFRRADGAYRWHLSRAHAMRDASGAISIWTGSNTEIHAQKEMEETLRNRETALRASEARLRESEERFRNLADNISQLAWTCDVFGNVTWYNKRWLDYTGLTFEDMKGWDWSKVQHPDHLDRVVTHVKRSAETGEPWEDTFPLRGKDGRYRWFLSRALPIRDSDGTIVRWFGTNTDITERKQAEEQQRLLVREMNHRIGNLFALAGAVTTLSTRFAATPKDLANAVQDRLVALARAHDLTLPKVNGEAKPDQATTMSEVVGTITAPYANQDRTTVVINGPDVPIKGKSVMSVALLLHEIATNAAKYGALSSPNGRVEASWSVQGNELLLTWRERGGPPVNGPPEKQGFGSLLTRLAVTGQLGGKISHDWSQEGLTLYLAAPLDRLVN